MVDEPQAPVFGPNGAVLNAPGLSDAARDAIVESERPPKKPVAPFRLKDLRVALGNLAVVLAVFFGPAVLVGFATTKAAEALQLSKQTNIRAVDIGLWMQQWALSTTWLFLLFATVCETPRPPLRVWLALAAATSGSLAALLLNSPPVTGFAEMRALGRPLGFIFVASGLLAAWCERRILLSMLRSK